MEIRLVPIWLDMDGWHACSCPPNFPTYRKKCGREKCESEEMDNQTTTREELVDSRFTREPLVVAIRDKSLDSRPAGQRIPQKVEPMKHIEAPEPAPPKEHRTVFVMNQNEKHKHPDDLNDPR